MVPFRGSRVQAACTSLARAMGLSTGAIFSIMHLSICTVSTVLMFSVRTEGHLHLVPTKGQASATVLYKRDSDRGIESFYRLGLGEWSGEWIQDSKMKLAIHDFRG